MAAARRARARVRVGRAAILEWPSRAPPSVQMHAALSCVQSSSRYSKATLLYVQPPTVPPPSSHASPPPPCALPAAALCLTHATLSPSHGCLVWQVRRTALELLLHHFPLPRSPRHGGGIAGPDRVHPPTRSAHAFSPPPTPDRPLDATRHLTSSTSSSIMPPSLFNPFDGPSPAPPSTVSDHGSHTRPALA